MALAGRNHVLLGGAADQAVAALDADERHPVLLRGRCGLLDLVDVDVRKPNVTRLAFLHELAERLDGLGERRHPVGLVQHVDIDHVGAQPLE